MEKWELMRRSVAAVGIVLAVGLLAGCGGADDSATPTAPTSTQQATPTPSPTSTQTASTGSFPEPDLSRCAVEFDEDLSLPEPLPEGDAFTTTDALNAWKQAICMPFTEWLPTYLSPEMTVDQARAYMSAYLDADSLDKFTAQYAEFQKIMDPLKEGTAGPTGLEDEQWEAFYAARGFTWIPIKVLSGMSPTDLRYTKPSGITSEVGPSGPVLKVPFKVRVRMEFGEGMEVFEADSWTFTWEGDYTMEPNLEPEDPAAPWRITDYWLTLSNSPGWED